MSIPLQALFENAVAKVGDTSGLDHSDALLRAVCGADGDVATLGNGAGLLERAWLYWLRPFHS